MEAKIGDWKLDCRSSIKEKELKKRENKFDPTQVDESTAIHTQ